MFVNEDRGRCLRLLSGTRCGLLFSGGGLAWRVGEHRAIAASARHDDRKCDRGDHEDYGRPRSETGEKVGRATRAKGSLRTLATECSSEVCGFALLNEDDADKEETDYDVQNDEQNEHVRTLPSRPQSGEIMECEATNRAR